MNRLLPALIGVCVYLGSACGKGTIYAEGDDTRGAAQRPDGSGGSSESVNPVMPGDGLAGAVGSLGGSAGSGSMAAADGGAVAGEATSSSDTSQPSPTAAPVVTRCQYPGVSDPNVLAALEAREGSQVTSADQLLDATRAAIEAARTRLDPALRALFGLESNGSAGPSSLTSIDWDPKHDAATFGTTLGQNVAALLSSDPSAGGQALAVVGQSDTARYLALGGNPFRTNPSRNNSSVTSAAMDQLLVNAVGWLTATSRDAAKRIVIAHLDDSYWFADDSSVRAWLSAKFPTQVTMNDSGTCDAAALSGCLETKPDLLIISQFHDPQSHDPSAIAEAVRAALADGVPVLYLQYDGSMNALGNRLLSLLHVRYLGDNYWSTLQVSGFDGRTALGRLPNAYAQIDATLAHLRMRAFDFSLADVAADPSKHAIYQAQFGAGAAAVRELLRAHDGAHQGLFADCTHGVDKLLVLVGDRLRQDVRYPMSHLQTDPSVFLRAYFADHAVATLRSVGPAQPDRGNFDPNDLSKVAGVTKLVTLTSRPSFRSAGVYLLPGRATRITRLDSSQVHTAIFVNTIRDGATHEWSGESDAYPRPKFLQSAHIPIASGETIVITNPYGGPLQVEFDASDMPVELKFENVGEHPHWSNHADDTRFAERLAQGTYNWVEVATGGFELHSRLDKFQSTMQDARWNTPAKLAATIEKYTFDEVHIMAGFAGEGISERAEVHGWAAAQGLTVPILEQVKHANMDQATCGSGCSGNPYDADWSFSPIGHGDLHELGHSLQSSRFQLSHNGSSYGNHAVTNWSPFHSASRYYEDHGGPVPEWKIPHAHLFAELQAAHAQGDRLDSFSDHMNVYLGNAIANAAEIRNCYAFFMQAGMSARHAGVLRNGYYIVPRVHILERAFVQALDDETTWSEASKSVGFDRFSYAAAKAISNNDFMLVALSFVTKLDYRDYFAMWGVQTSATANAQVESFGFAAVPRAFFAMSEADHSLGALSTEFERIQRLPIDGKTLWPAP